MPDVPDVSNFGDAQGFVSLLATLGLGLFTARNLRKGQQETHDLDADKQKIDRERLDNERKAALALEQDRFVGTLRDEITRLSTARDADQERHDRDMERMQTRFDTERRVCAREVRHMHEELMAAASSIRGEAEQAAARDAAHRGDTHLRFDHGEEEQ